MVRLPAQDTRVLMSCRVEGVLGYVGGWMDGWGCVLEREKEDVGEMG